MATARPDPAAPGDSVAARSFERMREAFECARAAAPAHDATYRFAGHVARVRIVGPELAEYLGRPIEHLRRPAPEGLDPELTIEAWDSSRTAVPCPDGRAVPSVRVAWRAGDDALGISADERFVVHLRDGAAVWLDRGAGHAVGWYRSASACSFQERAKPLILLLRAWYADRGVQLVHAGLIARAGQGVLVAGPGGAGKSTTTLACARAGFAYLGDDYVGIEERPDGSFVGHSLYLSARLNRRHAAQFVGLAPWAAKDADLPVDQKLLLLPKTRSPEGCRSAIVRVVLLPRLTESVETIVRPASKADALRTVAPNSLRQPLAASANNFDRLVRLVQRTPTYWLALGRDLDRVPLAVQCALDEVAVGRKSPA